MWMLPLYLHVNQKSDYDMKNSQITVADTNAWLGPSCPRVTEMNVVYKCVNLTEIIFISLTTNHSKIIGTQDKGLKVLDLSPQKHMLWVVIRGAF